MSFNPHLHFSKQVFNKLTEVFEYFKSYYLVSILLKVEKAHGKLTINVDKSRINGLNIDASILEDTIFDSEWATKHFRINYVGTYTIDAIFTHKNGEYVLDGSEITSEVH